VTAFIKTEPTLAQPNLQLYCAPVMVPTPLFVPPMTHGFTLLANLVAPRSRGSMRLRSSNPADMPIIEPNYLGDPRDLAAAVDGLRYLRSIIAAAPMKRLTKQVVGPDPAMESDEELATYCKAVTETNFHPVGSCRMGLDSNSSAVLTPALAVRGVNGLRVFDASMMPSIISANTNAPVMAVADRAVDLMIAGAA
jgi:choline dehydrogenase-like flavoprotein